MKGYTGTTRHCFSSRLLKIPERSTISQLSGGLVGSTNRPPSWRDALRTAQTLHTALSMGLFHSPYRLRDSMTSRWWPARTFPSARFTSSSEIVSPLSGRTRVRNCCKMRGGPTSSAALAHEASGQGARPYGRPDNARARDEPPPKSASALARCLRAGRSLPAAGVGLAPVVAWRKRCGGAARAGQLPPPRRRVTQRCRRPSPRHRLARL